MSSPALIVRRRTSAISGTRLSRTSPSVTIRFGSLSSSSRSRNTVRSWVTSMTLSSSLVPSGDDMNALTASRMRDSTPAASGDASLSNPRPRSWMRRTTSGGSSRAAPSSSSSRSWKLVSVSPMRVSRLSASMSWSETRSPARAWTDSLSTIGVTAAMNGSVSSTVRWTQKPRIDTTTASPVSTTSTQAPTRRNRLWDGA